MATVTKQKKRTNSRAPRLPEEYSRKLAYRLRELRQAKGLTQAQVAQAVGIAEYTYQKYESAKSTESTNSNPRIGTLYALSLVFEIDLSELLPVSFDMSGTDKESALK